MSQRKIAIIGHSGAGKSATLIELKNRGYIVAEMDSALGTSMSPSFQKSTEWITTCEAMFLAISVHKEMLENFVEAKKNMSSRAFFNEVLFIYLLKKKENLKDFLLKPNAEGKQRKQDIQGVLTGYDDLHNIFIDLADFIIDTTDKDTFVVTNGIIKSSF